MSIEPSETSPASDTPSPATPESQAATESSTPATPAMAGDTAPQPGAVDPVAEPEGEAFPVPRLKIGSQRGGEKVKAKAQIESKFVEAPPAKSFPPPNKRSELSADLQAELDEALGGMSLDDIVSGKAASNLAALGDIEPETRVKATVAKIHRGNVFFELGGRNQGLAPMASFAEPPVEGAAMDVIVSRFDPEEGLYLVNVPGGATAVGDWSQISQGVTVEAKITGHNKGGLECDVNRIRGFIPAGQISLYRVEDLAQFVGQKMLCIVTEANPDRRNLILSHRAVLEREKEAAQEKLRGEIAVGQVREGIVRSIRDFGAFVDLGGIDGLLHVSQLSWARVKHPSDVLTEGQTVTVKIHKIDPETGKLSLAMKELTESPWEGVVQRYPARSTVEGTVSKVMDFGAFIQLEPGVEGLVHISEIAHQRVFRVSDFLKEGQRVEVQIQSVDAEKQRISLSMKAMLAKPEPVKKDAEPAAEEEAPPPPMPKQPSKPLKGGIGRGTGGDKFGLKW
ncbi:MAG: S1 RNA-binding domain-containing protein [Pirellulales bacterium]